jgi:hypothetical protein
MAQKRRPRESKANVVERPTLEPKPLRVNLLDVPLVRPVISPGLFRRLDIARRLTRAGITAVVSKAGLKPMGGGVGMVETHVELSPAVPWVNGRGWLEAVGVLRSWFATTTIFFQPTSPNQEEGTLYIWLDGLTEGDAYVAQIRVGGWSANPQVPGTYNIGASDAAHADVHHTGASQTLSVFIPGVSGGPLSLIRIDTKGLGGWLFDDVLVMHLGKLS